MQDLTNRVKEVAIKLKADDVGIAPIERLDGAPEHGHPSRYLPEARVVVSILLRGNTAIQRALLRGISNFSYSRFEMKLLWEQLDYAAYHVSKMLEDEGFEAYPIPANLYYNFADFKPELSHKHVAMAAGLGNPGLSQNFISTKYGATVRLVSIITSAPLIADPMVEKRLCDDCLACITICPNRAIIKDEKVSFIMGGKAYETAKVDFLKCIWACGGLQSKGTYAWTDIPFPDGDNVNALEAYTKAWDNQDRGQRILPDLLCQMVWCSKCLAICHPEKQGEERKELIYWANEAQKSYSQV